ncbi:protein ImuA [Chitinophaga terrae (ex Kim and Jung 2007)]|uniref:ImuA family protein n=1 Tax=Chitinophaga terrae (ex Kim and Jung 2007) TaxID=408074 RepID=UPI0027889909|nr:Error-prone repair protein ImuA [Chitinophaga terrae (ex Kim and Jung 2007)]MDQ0107402.1 protein ImuA [Chitinophaga terrae (ex Kim and Jung 2007)]
MATKEEIVNGLRKELLLLQGFRTASSEQAKVDLGEMNACFPNGIFPAHGVHEIISLSMADRPACSGFISAIAGMLMKNSGPGIWISTEQRIYPPALMLFGIIPERIIFVQVPRPVDVCWAMEEALKTEGLAVVIGELQELGFETSRRLQLAVEKSKVTGFVLRHLPRRMNPTAALSRIRVSPVRSAMEEGMPGVGDPRWQVEVLKIRNGKPGKYLMEWVDDRFIPVTGTGNEGFTEQRKIG